MTAPLIYNVLTEFRFEAGSAILGSEKLAGAVDQVSSAADNALLSFKKLGLGVVAQMGLAEGSILGILGESIKMADKFKQTQLAFANIISSNREHLVGPIDTFNDRLGVSEMIMKNIGKAARDFALDEGDLLEMSKLLSAALVPMGLAGKNFGNAIDMSRTLLKSAPTLGVSTSDVQGQLLRAIQGGASTGDTLFRRLSSETGAFKGIGGSQGGAQAFNALPAAKRVEILTKSLAQFASDTDVLSGNVNTLAGQFRALNTVIRGPISGILKPLGDALLKPIVDTMKRFTHMLDTDGRALVAALAEFIGPILENPRKLIINLLQLKNLSKDIKTGGSIFGILGIGSALMHLGKIFPIVGEALAGIAAVAFGAIAGLIAIIPWMKVLGFVFSTLGAFVSRILPGMLFLTGILQTISRAIAIAKVRDLEALPKILPVFTAMMTRLKNAIGLIFAPFAAVIDAAANFIAPLFQITTAWNVLSGVFELFIQLMENLGTVSILAWAGLNGLFFGLFQFIKNLSEGKILNAFSGVADAFNAGVTDVIEKNLKGLGDQNGAIVNQVTNIGKVEIKNQFKENMEPDRIAFSLTKQLQKVAQNPTQSRGRQFAPVGGAT